MRLQSGAGGTVDVTPTLSTGTSVSAFEGRPGDALSGRGLVTWNLQRVRVAQGVSQERLAADAGGGAGPISAVWSV